MKGLGVKAANDYDVMPKRIDGLDDKFWVWETLEEATRGSVSSITKDELFAFYSGWCF